MALTLTLNGTPRTFEQLTSGATIIDLIGALELKSDRIALEHNGQITPRARWITHPLAEGDRIELVQFVGGGAIISSTT